MSKMAKIFIIFLICDVIYKVVQKTVYPSKFWPVQVPIFVLTKNPFRYVTYILFDQEKHQMDPRDENLLHCTIHGVLQL